MTSIWNIFFHGLWFVKLLESLYLVCNFYFVLICINKKDTKRYKRHQLAWAGRLHKSLRRDLLYLYREPLANSLWLPHLCRVRWRATNALGISVPPSKLTLPKGETYTCFQTNTIHGEVSGGRWIMRRECRDATGAPSLLPTWGKGTQDQPTCTQASLISLWVMVT